MAASTHVPRSAVLRPPHIVADMCLGTTKGSPTAARTELATKRERMVVRAPSSRA